MQGKLGLRVFFSGRWVSGLCGDLRFHGIRFAAPWNDGLGMLCSVRVLGGWRRGVIGLLRSSQ